VLSLLLCPSSLFPNPYPPPLFYRVHPLKRASSSRLYSQCAVYIVVVPCAKGHFIHAGSLDPEFFFFLIQGQTKEYRGIMELGRTCQDIIKRQYRYPDSQKTALPELLLPTTSLMSTWHYYPLPTQYPTR
jgi:hypothetical protein